MDVTAMMDELYDKLILLGYEQGFVKAKYNSKLISKGVTNHWIEVIFQFRIIPVNNSHNLNRIIVLSNQISKMVVLVKWSLN